jgi:hypothetical protein
VTVLSKIFSTDSWAFIGGEKINQKENSRAFSRITLLNDKRCTDIHAKTFMQNRRRHAVGEDMDL